MLEIEIKAYCDDIETLRKKVESLGAKEEGVVREADTYFNHPSRDFAKTDEALRIRSTEDNIILTYKGQKLSSRAKTRLEEEVTVDNFEMMKSILLRLGFKDAGDVVKVRSYYIINGIHICLDRVEELGDFVELEKIGTDKDETEKELFRLAKKLGISRFETRSYLELLLEARRITDV